MFLDILLRISISRFWYNARRYLHRMIYAFRYAVPVFNENEIIAKTIEFDLSRIPVAAIQVTRIVLPQFSKSSQICAANVKAKAEY